MPVTAPRSYGQNCSLARAMDLLGERWTVLIVRELTRGPKRFGDLAQSLPGIGTTMLSARLKRLEHADVITRAPGGGGTGYWLTDRGDRLAHALGELMLWGLELPELYQPHDQSRAVWLAMNLQAALQRTPDRLPAGTVAFHVDDERFWLHLTQQQCTLHDGAPPYPPDVTLRCALEEFHALAHGTPPADLPTLEVTGDADRLADVLGFLHLLPDAQTPLS